MIAFYNEGISHKGPDAMFKQYRTFLSTVSIIVLSTVVVLIMYTYTIETSLTTVKEDIKTNNLNRLRILINSLDKNVEQLGMLSVAINADSKMGLLKSIDMMNNYEQDQLMLDLSDKMNLHTFTEGWNVQLAIYSTLLNKWVGPAQSESPPPADMQEGKWILESPIKSFALYRSYPYFTIRVTFPESNLRQLLDSAKADNNDPFFYQSDYPLISSRFSNNEKINELLSKLTSRITGQIEGTELISIGDMDYMVSYLRSEELGWYMIDYVPLGDALQPIVRTQYYFYFTCLLLLVTGIITVTFFYRKVQVPILTLLKGVRQLKNGEFSHRIRRTSNNEFDILYFNFNDMAQQIEDLIEKVYKEKIISREALVKQLQAQINPHFLYNCLFFINNMNRLGNDEAVTAMTQNLAEYFRYTTRLNEPLTALDKEIGVVRNYLNIQSLRMERLQFDIHIPDSMKSCQVPKLLIQPLVENSVIHGIEKSQLAGLVRIRGSENEKGFSLTVEDDGKGMTHEEILALTSRIKQPLDDTMGCALWNIRQRMLIYFGTDSSMRIDRSVLGGLLVELNWPHRNEQED